MDERDLLKRIQLLEYHQKLLLELVNNPNLEFNKLVIENGISQQEVQNFLKLCEEMCIKIDDQKAEGFVYFHPLFDEFAASLPPAFQTKEVISACLRQKLFESLMLEFKKYI